METCNTVVTPGVADSDEHVNRFSLRALAGSWQSQRSTNGGFVTHGNRLLLHGWTLLTNVPLSSGEAELNVHVKGITESLGFRSAAQSIGMTLVQQCYSDSTAARGILNRVGVGKLRDLEVKRVWVRQKEADEFEHSNVLCKPSDVLTHRVGAAEFCSNSWHE